jgi:SPP1 gp7 family putative phage head morphogenesis protein
MSQNPNLNSSTESKLYRIHEEYDASIKDRVEIVEARFKDVVYQALANINNKLETYLRDMFVNVEKSVNNDLQTTMGDAFNIDMSTLIPLIEIGIGYMTSKIYNALTKLHIKPSQVQTSFGINFNQAPTRYVDLLVERRKYLSEVLQKTTYDSVQNIIKQGLAEGTSYKDMAIRINDVLGPDAVNRRAEVIARTESNYALNEGQRRYADSLGVKYYQIALARSACPICVGVAKDKNQQLIQFQISDAGILPIHPNCRCTLYSVIPEDWYK